MDKREKTFRYSKAFRNEVLKNVKNKKLTVLEAGKYYGVGFPTIYRWLKKANYDTPCKEVIFVKLSDQHSALQEIEELKKENRALKEAVSKLTLDKLCLEKCVEIGERDFGMELKKKPEVQELRKSGRK